MRRVALAVPLEKVVVGDVFAQWLQILLGYANDPERTCHLGPPFRFRPAYIVPMRNGLTASLLARDNWDDVLWVDSDIMPDAALPRRVGELVQHPAYLAPDGGVIVGAYYQRDYPFEVQLFRLHGEEEGLRFIHPLQWLPMLTKSMANYSAGIPGDLVRIGGGGAGLMLIRRDVLERLMKDKGPDKVWETPAIEPDLLARVRAANEDRAYGVWTEDVYLCFDVAKRYGIQVLADTDFRFSGAHVGVNRVDAQNYIAAHTVPPGFEHGDKTLMKLPPGYAVVESDKVDAAALS